LDIIQENCSRFGGAGHNTIIGARIQYGYFDTSVYRLILPRDFGFAWNLQTPQSFTSLFQAHQFYGYHQWQIFDLQLIGGVDIRP